MKKILMAVAVLAVVGLAAEVFAWDIPTSGGGLENAVKGAATKLGKDQIAKKYNEKIADYKCKFVGNSLDKTTCDLNKIISELAAARVAGDQVFGSNVRVAVVANASPGKKSVSAYDRARAIEKKLRTKIDYWGYDVNGNDSAKDNGLNITIKIH